MMKKAIYATAFAALAGLGSVQSAIAMAADLSETEVLSSVSPSPVAKPESANPETIIPEAVSPEPINPDAVSPESVSPDAFVSETMRLELRLSERRLAVYRGDMLIANYSVAVGREGWQTPTGEFSVFQKQRDPAWEHPFTGEVIPPGPENPLGTRWIGFWSDGENSIGFHGTPDESVIGSAVSHGCVRMRNEDVLALYEQVTVDTVVTVLP